MASLREEGGSWSVESEDPFSRSGAGAQGEHATTRACEFSLHSPPGVARKGWRAEAPGRPSQHVDAWRRRKAPSRLLRDLPASAGKRKKASLPCGLRSRPRVKDFWLSFGAAEPVPNERVSGAGFGRRWKVGIMGTHHSVTPIFLHLVFHFRHFRHSRHSRHCFSRPL